MIEEQNNPNPSGENLFDKMNNVPNMPPVKRVQRSKNDVVIAGVCSGLAEYLNTDAANIRLIALLTLLLGGWSVAAYLLTALLLPVEQNPRQLSENEKETMHKENFRIVLSGLLILTGFHYALLYLGIGRNARIFILPNSFIFPVGAIAAGVYFLVISSSGKSFANVKREEKFFRSRTDKIIMGVCGGLAKYLNVDSSALRIIFILAALLTLGVFVVLYFFLGIITKFEAEQRLEQS